MRVRHSAEELGEGETMVMTLADRPIMDARGELAEDADELENALVVRPAPGVEPDGRASWAARAYAPLCGELAGGTESYSV